MKLGGWFDRSLCPIGIDVGSHSIKAVQLSRKREGFALLAAAAVRRSDAPSDPAQRGADDARLIRQLLAQAPFKGRNIVTTLPADRVMCKSIRLPRMPAEELRAAVSWEAQQLLGVSERAMVLQYLDAGEVRQGEEIRQELIVMAAENEAVEGHTHALMAAGLNPLAIDAAPVALARWVAPQDPADEEPVRVLLDVGHAASKVVILRQGRIVFFKSIPIGSGTLDQKVAQRLSVPEEQACELRRKTIQGETGAADEALFGSGRRETLGRAIFESIRPPLGELAREVGLCLRYFSVTFRGQRPESVLLAGGGAFEPLLEKALAEDAGLVSKPAVPHVTVDTALVPELGSIGQTGGGAWSVALGLSMRLPQSKKHKGAA